MNKILFIDTLTTGLDSDRCGLYRIGGIFCREEGDTLGEQGRFELSMRPSAHARISDNSLWAGNVTRSSLAAFPAQEEVFAEFRRMLDAQVSVRNSRDKIFISGYNVTGFDLPFLRGWFRQNSDTHFRDYFYVQAIDIMTMAAWYLLDSRQDMEDFHLETAARHLGVVCRQARRGSCLDNAAACLEIYRELRGRVHTVRSLAHRLSQDTVENVKII